MDIDPRRHIPAKFNLAFSYTATGHTADRIQDLDGRYFDTAEEAFTAGLEILAEHTYANRFRILMSSLDGYTKSLVWDSVAQYDIDRDTMWPTNWDIDADMPDPSKMVKPSAKPIAVIRREAVKAARSFGALDYVADYFAAWYLRERRTEDYGLAYDVYSTIGGGLTRAQMDAKYGPVIR
ncbi:hypothetical protein [Streptomyces californicus]|uniref:hypothetical protein n=1 Tax=Streptomyces californicus TaxID=67351 RepID=UPI0012FF27D4|nr:hypothetical protein [Streptomyces californicus]QRV53453.1 hypothetical protein I6J40_04025 [Streptomyces californicus]